VALPAARRPPLRAFHPGRAWPHHAIALDDIEDGIFAKPKPMADFPVGLLNVYFKRDGLAHRALTLSPRLSFHAPASEPESPVRFDRNTPRGFALDLTFAGLSLA
jgi:hypothetical protein